MPLPACASTGRAQLTNPAHGRFAGAPELTVLQARFASYFGVTRKQMIALGGIARRFQADAIIGMGADIPPYLAAAGTIPCVWYIGDEWVSHYSSLFNPREVRTWRYLKSAAIWGLYERAFAPDLERIWVVSDREERQMRRWTSATQSTHCQTESMATISRPCRRRSAPTPPFSGDASTSRPTCRPCSGSAPRYGPC